MESPSQGWKILFRRIRQSWQLVGSSMVKPWKLTRRRRPPLTPRYSSSFQLTPPELVTHPPTSDLDVSAALQQKIQEATKSLNDLPLEEKIDEHAAARYVERLEEYVGELQNDPKALAQLMGVPSSGPQYSNTDSQNTTNHPMATTTSDVRTSTNEQPFDFSDQKELLAEIEKEQGISIQQIIDKHKSH